MDQMVNKLGSCSLTHSISKNPFHTVYIRKSLVKDTRKRVSLDGGEIGIKNMKLQNLLLIFSNFKMALTGKE
jgi:hypothetical protein